MRYAILLCVLILAGCIARQPPAISQIDGDSVSIVGYALSTSLWGDYDLTEFDAKAAEACAIYDKTPTEPLSVRYLGDSTIRVLYACT